MNIQRQDLGRLKIWQGKNCHLNKSEPLVFPTEHPQSVYEKVDAGVKEFDPGIFASVGFGAVFTQSKRPHSS